MFERPQVVAFDALETLFSLEPLRPRLVRAGLPALALELWYARVLRDGFALSAAGAPRPMMEVAEAELRVLLASCDVPPVQTIVDDVLAGLSELRAFPEAKEALTALRDAQLRVVVLTNGGEANSERMLERSGLSSLVERVLSVDTVGPWKPFAEPYLWAARECGVQPEQLALVTCHAWDVLGATAAGLTAAWVSRQERLLLDVAPPPAVVGRDLLEVSRALLAGPRPRLDAAPVQ